VMPAPQEERGAPASKQGSAPPSGIPDLDESPRTRRHILTSDDD
jgi:hypothetical protein